MLKSLFNKIAGLKACNIVKSSIIHRCFLVIVAKLLRATFYRTALVAACIQRFKVTATVRLFLKSFCFHKVDQSKDFMTSQC